MISLLLHVAFWWIVVSLVFAVGWVALRDYIRKP